ncbi:MAG: ankyrin repeat domain-containing protein [Proteobacteria bacterium]|nr:ankyrin repeat domain-containing protein [Pseudomonadota bacterium]MBU1716298.1 ankyrin repeat domain-containing protein [Pseudomonadota bacterium]
MNSNLPCLRIHWLIASFFVSLIMWQIISGQSSWADTTAPSAGKDMKPSSSLVIQSSPQIIRSREYASPSYNPAKDDPPIHAAVRRNDWQAVQRLIAEGADINATTKYLQTPLIVAISSGHDEMARRLIEAGADLNPLGTKEVVLERSPTSTGSVEPTSPLSWAIVKKNEKLVLFLLEKGATFNEFESKYDKSFERVYKMLLSLGSYDSAKKMLVKADQDQRQKSVNNMLFWAIRYVKENKFEILKFLIEQNANLDVFDQRGVTPLLEATMLADLDTVTFLLDNGAKVDNPSIQGKSSSSDTGATAMLFAFSKAFVGSTSLSERAKEANYLSIGKLLLARGANVNHQGNNKLAAIHYLIKAPEPIEFIELFCEHDANLDLQGGRGITILRQFLDLNRLDIADFLLAKGADINSDSIDLVRYLRESDRSNNPKNNDSVVNFLLANNFDLNKQKKANTLPLIYAAETGNIEYFEKFISLGADVNLKDLAGKTPLFSAVQGGNLEIVKILMASGAEVNSKNKEGLTSFMLASISGQQEIAEFLKSQGADTTGVVTDPTTIALLKKYKLIPEESCGVIDENFTYIQFMLRSQYGKSIKDLANPNPRFASPEKTWELYKQALIKGDLEFAAKCHLPNSSTMEMYEQLGQEKTSEIAKNFRPIQRVSGDDERCEYRIKRMQLGTEISYTITFVNVFGEWKIEQF